MRTKSNQFTFCNLDTMAENTARTLQNSGKSVREPCLEPCPIERGMRVLGGKWTGSILWHLQDGPVRFNDIARRLGGASKKMVDQRLKELESRGLVHREVLSTRPIAVTYELTGFGRTALGILEDLKDWTEKNRI